MQAQEVLYMIIGILVVSFLFDRLLDYLNTTYWSDELPKELKDIYDADNYRKSQRYERAKHRFSMISETISVLILLFVLYFSGFALLDNYLRLISDNEIVLALLFFGVLGLVMDLIMLPLSLYRIFVIEQRFGFNTMTIKTFFVDKLKNYLLGIIIGGGLLSLIVFIFQMSANLFWIFAWVVISVFSIFLSMFYSTLIVPLFNKQTPLEEGELRNAIETFATKVGFRLQNIYVINASKRSKKSNAYFTGLGARKRIVLFDTLINNHSTEELVAVLAHEIGHYKKKHVIQGLVVSLLSTGLMLFILNLFLQSPLLSESLGSDQMSFHLSVLAFGILYSPISVITSLFGNVLSRRNEFQADEFAAKNYDAKPMMQALKKLSVDNLSNLRPHPLYVFIHYSHPTLLQRLKRISNFSI